MRWPVLGLVSLVISGFYGLAGCGPSGKDGAVSARADGTRQTMEFRWDDRPLTRMGEGVLPVAVIGEEGEPLDMEPVSLGLPADREDLRPTLAWTLEDGRMLVLDCGGEAPEGAAECRARIDRLNPGERIALRFSVNEDEMLSGLTERVVATESQEDAWKPGRTEALDLRGQRVEVFVRPTLGLYKPTLVSTGAWGLSVESDWPSVWDVAATDPRRVEVLQEADPSDTEVVFRVFGGPDPIDVLSRQARAEGTTILPPEWAFGHWRWRDEHFPLDAFYDGTPWQGPFNSMVVEDVLMMEALGIPCSVYWVDRPWGPGRFGYDDLQWDETRFPEARRMIAWLRDRGIRFLVWIAPWAVGPRMTAEAIDRRYQVEPENPFSAPAPPEAMLIDFTNPAAAAWWQQALMDRIREDGLAGFKCDRGEEKPPDGLWITGRYADGTDFRKGHNAYPLWYARTVHGALQGSGIGEFVSILRAGWRGSQRHTIFWGGDTKGSAWGLRSAIVGLLRSATMNFPVWGSDTCGYSGDPSREVCRRWLAFSAFSPLMEVGPTSNAAPWSLAPEGTPTVVSAVGYLYEPDYDPDLVATWILYANLHEDLRGYLFQQARRSHQDGTPIVRPVALAHPDRPEARALWNEYYLGPDLVVAALWQEGQREAEVFVPPDGRWIDAWTRKVLDPGTVQAVPTPLHRIPILVREGSPADVLGDLEERWRQALDRASRTPDLPALARDLEQSLR